MSEERRAADVKAAELRARNPPELDQLRVQNKMLRQEAEQLVRPCSARVTSVQQRVRRNK